MAQWSCPLCCDESFDTPNALKCHLECILENLVCPVCQEKFSGIENLAVHLESDCGSLVIDECTQSNESDKLDGEQNVDPEESILAKVLLEGSKQCKEEPEDEPQYFCQTCGTDFADIDTHLQDFHEGQEIILEVGDQDYQETVEVEDSSTNEDQSIVFVINPTKSENDDPTPPPDAPPITQQPNTVVQEDVKDKDGRLYTRKFVKIDKFWLQNSQNDETSYVINYTDKKFERDKTVPALTLCQICNLYFPTNEASLHNCDEKPKKVQLCEICNTTFPTFKSLRLHRRMHEPIKTREVEAPANYDEGEDPLRQMFICRICHKSYDKEYEQVHMNSHESNNEFNCDVCNRKFFTKSNLDMHMKAHTNNKKFTCSYCKKSFVTYDALNDHLLNQCQKRAYACQYCGRRFARPHEKVKHERIHTGEKPHVCDICGKAFRVSYCLTLHLRTHSGTRPYQCSHCGKRFKSHSVYNHHLMTHSDVRAYKCPYCPKAFKTSVQLAGHKNSHIKPFTCTECNRPFASLYAVRAHMETHKRDNNLKYECWMCGALYSRAFALRDHLKHQHQQEDGEKAKAELVGVDEEMEAANSILVNEEDIILGLDGASIEIIENEGD